MAVDIFYIVYKVSYKHRSKSPTVNFEFKIFSYFSGIFIKNLSYKHGFFFPGDNLSMHFNRFQSPEMKISVLSQYGENARLY